MNPIRSNRFLACAVLLLCVGFRTAAAPAQQSAQQMPSPLAIQWEAPKAQDTTISGRVTVTNNTAASLTATVIVVAVNEIGKAFVLGYEQINVRAQSQSRPVPFASSLPYGTYVVHADAIADIPSTQFIYRARLQSPPITISPPF
jgi:hypothetical protein